MNNWLNYNVSLLYEVANCLMVINRKQNVDNVELMILLSFLMKGKVICCMLYHITVIMNILLSCLECKIFLLWLSKSHQFEKILEAENENNKRYYL